MDGESHGERMFVTCPICHENVTCNSEEMSRKRWNISRHIAKKHNGSIDDNGKLDEETQMIVDEVYPLQGSLALALCKEANAPIYRS